jgi:hypothetical protein
MDMLCLLVLVSCVDSKVYNQGMHEVEPSKMVKADESEMVTVAHCETPISIEQLGPKPGLATNIYHTSLVFHLPNSNTNSSIQFTANAFNSSIFLPTLSRSASEAPEIEWENAASIHAKEGVVDYTYWLRKKELGTISGDKYNKLLEWLDSNETNANFAQYFLFQLQDQTLTKNASEQTTLVRSTTCYDFVEAALLLLKDEGSQLKEWSGRDWTYSVVKHGSQVAVANVSEPRVKEQLWQYYSNVSIAFAEVMSLHPNSTNITEIMHAIAQVMAVERGQSDGEAFVYSGDTYYQFTSTAPFTSYVYS